MEKMRIENEAAVEVTGEILPADEHEDLAVNKNASIAPASRPSAVSSNQRYFLRYLALPFLFLTVALLGGLRLSGVDSSFVFLRPPLLCLIFSAIMLALFFRAGLVRMEGWFSEQFSILRNMANGVVLIALFAATTQLFNSLLPEQGLPFWVVGFCFFWTLWNNLFADFDTKKLLRSLGGLFGLAFVVKYLVLANLTAPASEGWLRGIFENPGKEAFTWALDLPRFSSGTGYIQFFAIAFYLLGLFLLPASTRDHDYEI
jgi:hypothetical protein